MHTLRQYWERLFSRQRTSSVPDGQQLPRPEELEREISIISSEGQALAKKVQQISSDLEHARDEDHRKLTGIESLRNRFTTAMESVSRKNLNLDKRIAELESERNKAHDKTRALEDALAETSTRLEKIVLQVNGMQVGLEAQAKQFKASLSDASNRLEATDNYVRELENSLKSERQDYLSTIQDMQGRFRKQDVRMNWAIAVAAVALLLGAVAGAVLIWDAQKNSRLLSSMSNDIRALMTSMNEQMGMQDAQQVEQLQPASSPPENPVVPASPSAAATISKPEPNPSLPDSALDRARSVNLNGIQQATRKDAKTFFAENAKIDGVVSLRSGVQYRVVTAGSGKSPSLADKVIVSYVGIKPDGTVFDETYSDEAPVTFRMKELMPGWQEVLMKMEEGAEFELYVPPKLTTRKGVRNRGMLGFEPNIYLIELLEVAEEGATDPAAPAD